MEQLRWCHQTLLLLQRRFLLANRFQNDSFSYAVTNGRRPCHCGEPIVGKAGGWIFFSAHVPGLVSMRSIIAEPPPPPTPSPLRMVASVTHGVDPRRPRDVITEISDRNGILRNPPPPQKKTTEPCCNDRIFSASDVDGTGTRRFMSHRRPAGGCDAPTTSPPFDAVSG